MNMVKKGFIKSYIYGQTLPRQLEVKYACWTCVETIQSIFTKKFKKTVIIHIIKRKLVLR